ncbi:vacuolar sorting protein VPS33/slp1, partial [Borealophlyctis nickersoniae]
MHEMLDENVTLVEDITRKRQGYPSSDAIYFIGPTETCVDKLIEDFSRPKPMYAAAHLYFTSALPDALFDKIKKSPVAPHIRTLKEMNVDFIACESQVFTLEQPQSLFTLYNPPSSSHVTAELGKIAKRLTSVLATLGEYPHIRYYDPSHSGTNLAAKLAHTVQEELDAMCRLDTDFPPQTEFKRAVLIIADRSLDMVSPLVHEFTYQAMMNDLLVLEGGKYIYKTEGGASTDSNAAQMASANLDEGDPIWMLIRHWHYAEAVEYIRGTFNKFLSENKAAASALGQPGEGATGIDSLKEMKETLSSLPQFQEMKTKFSVHINICQECKVMFERRRLDAVGLVEQDLATGETPDGRPVKNAMMDMVPLLDDENVSSYDKVRMLMLYIISLDGIQDAERRRLFEHARLSLEESQAITNLSMLGVRLSAPLDKKKGEKDERGPYAYKVHGKNKKKKKSDNDEVPYDLSRWVPVLKTVMM